MAIRRGPKKIQHGFLPVSIIERELRLYNNRPPVEINPCGTTWPSYKRASKANMKLFRKELITLIIKYKRRERWLQLRAELGEEYLERIHQRSTMIPETPVYLSDRGINASRQAVV